MGSKMSSAARSREHQTKRAEEYVRPLIHSHRYTVLLRLAYAAIMAIDCAEPAQEGAGEECEEDRAAVAGALMLLLQTYITHS